MASKETGEDTDGLFAVAEVVGLPGSGQAPHIHHRVDEVYCLLEGQLEVLDGGRTFTAEAGSVFRIPKGTLHAWKNGTNEIAKTLLFICPAGFEGFFEEAGCRLRISRRLPPKRTCRGCWSLDANTIPNIPHHPAGDSWVVCNETREEPVDARRAIGAHQDQIIKSGIRAYRLTAGLRLHNLLIEALVRFLTV